MKDKTKIRSHTVTGRFTTKELEQFNALKDFWNVNIAETIRRCLIDSYEKSKDLLQKN